MSECKMSRTRTVLLRPLIFFAFSGSVIVSAMFTMLVLGFAGKALVDREWGFLLVALAMLIPASGFAFIARWLNRKNQKMGMDPNGCARCGSDLSRSACIYQYSPREPICEQCAKIMSDLEGRTFPKYHYPDSKGATI